MIKKVILKLLKFYQKFFSLYFGRNCRFYPSCSEYCFQVIKKYGTFKGFFLSFRRILRCNPLNKGGVDMP